MTPTPLSMSSGLDPGVATPRKPLGQLLREAGFVTEAQLAGALNEGARTGERLGEVVVRRGWASEDDVAKLLAEQWQLGYVERSSISFDVDALTRMTREQAQRLEALPTRVQDGRVVVAVAEPTEERLATLRRVIGDDTVVVVVPKTALDAGVRSQLLDAEEHDEAFPPPPPAAPSARPQQQQPEQQPPQEPPPPHPAPQPQPQPVQPTWSAALEVHAVQALPQATPPLALPPRPGADADLAKVLQALEEAATEANALQQRLVDLTRRLELLSMGLANVKERLGGPPPAEAPEVK